VAPTEVQGAPAPVDALLLAAARVAPYLVLAPDDCLPAPADAEAGWPALAAAAAWVPLVVTRVVPVVSPQQVHEPRFVAVVPESPYARSAPECAPVQETRVEAEAAWSQPPVGSSRLRAALQLLAGRLP
jgi:hypothetical protein